MPAVTLELPKTPLLEKLPLENVEYVPHPLFDEDNAEAKIETLNPGLPARAELLSSRKDERSGGQDGAGIIQLCAAPMLDKKQEIYLFCRMNFLKYRAAEELRSSKRVPRGKREARIANLLHESLIIRNVIVESNLRLVASIAKRYVTLSHNLEEAISEGFSPLIRATELFDCSKGWAFSTYATHCVKNALGRVSSRSEKRRRKQGNLSQEVSALIEDERSPVVDPEPLLDRWGRLAEHFLVHLNDREKEIITARFGLEGRESHSYEQIGRSMDLSKERIRQISIAALAKLQRVAEEERLELPELERTL